MTHPPEFFLPNPDEDFLEHVKEQLRHNVDLDAVAAIIKTTKDCDTAAEMVVEYILKVINPRE